jgi:DNA-binding SARP family transcriptional activator/predicted ATPase/predicted negative regulator of RcsB-dependent stress response
VNTAAPLWYNENFNQRGRYFMAVLHIATLGPLQITLNHAPVSGFLSDKVRALLVYLAIEQTRPFRRESLATLLWPHQPRSKARANLRRALANLRHITDDDNGRFLHITRQTLQFRAASSAHIDAIQFGNLLQLEPTLAQMEAAVALINGRFLDGFSIDDSIPFEEWALLKREHFQRQELQLLHQLTTYYEAHHQPETAVRYAWQQVQTEPWFEPGQRQLLHLLAQTGQRAVALSHYEQFQAELRAELDVIPEPATRRLYEQIRQAPTPATAPRKTPPFLAEPPAVEPSPFVARTVEMAKLNHFLALAVTNQAQFIFITGEAGSGKSSLLHNFGQQAQRQNPRLIPLLGSSPAHVGPSNPYHAFRAVLAHALGNLEPLWRDGSLSRDQAIRLWSLRHKALALLAEIGSDSLAALVDATLLPDEMRTTAVSQSPPQEVLFEQVTHFLQKFSQYGPLLLLLDDLQWADSGTVDLLFHLWSQLAGYPILLLGTYRPEALATNGNQHPLMRLVHEVTHDLGAIEVALNQADGRSFVDAWLDKDPNRLSDRFRETLFTQTKGHALFTVELVNTLQERGDLHRDKAGRWLATETVCWDLLPAKTEAIIAERVSQLAPSLRQLLGIASIQGNTFTAEIVAQVGERPFAETLRTLSADLGRRYKLIQPLGRQAVEGQTVSRYRFRHNLFQQYAYGLLDPNERSYLHQRTGETMAELYKTAANQPSPLAAELAHHFEAAQQVAQAISYRQLAGQHALRLSAHSEAVAHYRHALTLLTTQPDTSERRQQELAAQLALGAALLAVNGYTNSEVKAAYERAYELCCQVEAAPEMITALFWLTSYYAVSGNLSQSVVVSEQMLAVVAKHEVSDMHQMQAHVLAGLPLFFMGCNAAALAHFRQASALYIPAKHQPLIYTFGQDPGIASMMWQGHVLLHMGCLAEAKSCLHQALDWAAAIAHPYTAAFTHLLAGGTPNIWYVEDSATALTHLEKAVDLAKSGSFAHLLALSTFYLGQVTAVSLLPTTDAANQKKAADAITRMQQGLRQEVSLGSRLGLSSRYLLLAGVYQQAGDIDEAWQMLKKGKAEATQRQESYFEPELFRLEGDLYLAAGNPGKAEACWHKAVQTARRQAARLWELRATISLCRLWHNQGDSVQAQQKLAAIFSCFRNEFVSQDVAEARQLLTALNQSQTKISQGELN